MRAKGRKSYNRLQRELKKEWKQQKKNSKLVKQVVQQKQHKEEVNKIMKQDEGFNELENLTQELEGWIESSKRLQSLQQKNTVILTQLKTMLSIKDQEINDIKHVIELGTFNASQGYKLAKEMQEVLKERRRIKAQIDAIEVLKEADFSKVHSTRDKLKTGVDKLQKPMQYNFRQRKELEKFLELKSYSRAEILKGSH